MFGSTVYNLTLFAEGTNSPKSVLWSKEGNQGSDWITAKVNVPAMQGLKVWFYHNIIPITPFKKENVPMTIS